MIVLEWVGALLMLVGSIFMFLSSLGLVRMPDLYTRMSASTKAATMGVALILLGFVFQYPLQGYSAQALVILIFLFATAPIGAHMIGRAAFMSRVEIWEGSICNELEGYYDEENPFVPSDASAVWPIQQPTSSQT